MNARRARAVPVLVALSLVMAVAVCAGGQTAPCPGQLTQVLRVAAGLIILC
jgi:hypothetical protein